MGCFEFDQNYRGFFFLEALFRLYRLYLYMLLLKFRKWIKSTIIFVLFYSKPLIEVLKTIKVILKDKNVHKKCYLNGNLNFRY